MVVVAFNHLSVINEQAEVIISLLFLNRSVPDLRSSPRWSLPRGRCRWWSRLPSTSGLASPCWWCSGPCPPSRWCRSLGGTKRVKRAQGRNNNNNSKVESTVKSELYWFEWHGVDGMTHQRGSQCRQPEKYQTRAPGRQTCLPGPGESLGSPRGPSRAGMNPCLFRDGERERGISAGANGSRIKDALIVI